MLLVVLLVLGLLLLVLGARSWSVKRVLPLLLLLMRRVLGRSRRSCSAGRRTNVASVCFQVALNRRSCPG
jgi:hypothetical protein